MSAPPDGAPDETVLDVVTISNVVITCSFNCTIDLPELAWRMNG